MGTQKRARYLLQLMHSEGWTSLPGHGGVFVHAKSKAIMIVYVDDMLLLATRKDTKMHRRALERKIDFKDPQQQLSRYFGARYSFSRPGARDTDARQLVTDMDMCVRDAVSNFEEERGAKLSKAISPYLAADEDCARGFVLRQAAEAVCITRCHIAILFACCTT